MHVTVKGDNILVVLLVLILGWAIYFGVCGYLVFQVGAGWTLWVAGIWGAIMVLGLITRPFSIMAETNKKAKQDNPELAANGWQPEHPRRGWVWIAMLCNLFAPVLAWFVAVIIASGGATYDVDDRYAMESDSN